MTGQLAVSAAGITVFVGGHPTPGMLQPMPGKTTRAVFELDEAACLYYNGARRFGWIRLTGTQPMRDRPVSQPARTGAATTR
jgi:hypothetical protein